MTDFDAWLTFAVGSDETQPGGEEGGWNGDDPSPSNPTWRGIEYDEACAFLNMPGMAADTFRSLVTRTCIGEIAKARYWARFHVDLLPSGPNVLYADGCFNGRGVENLQVTMNLLCPPFPPLKTDNVFGDKTLAGGALLLASLNYFHLAR
jgi:lysozyme family protein